MLHGGGSSAYLSCTAKGSVCRAVRFVLLPSATTLLVLGALRMGLRPADPVCAFMLLQSAMPPAQNLVLMMQLQQSTAGLAPATARLLPVTLLVPVFAKLVL
jgi:predicted permease